MNVRREQVNGWAQSSLIPPERVTIEITTHLDGKRMKAQCGVRVTSPDDDSTLGLSTWQIDVSMDGSSVVEEVAEVMRMAMQEHFFPF